MISAPPTAAELPTELAEQANFDGRTMLRMQSISEDGSVKTMASISLFDAPAEAFAAALSSEQEALEPTAINIMRHSNL